MQRGVAGIPTAWIATWGSGKPVISLGSDIDDIPQASQKPGVGYHDPMIDGAPGHGEGHNSGMPLNITAAIAVKKIMEREQASGHDPCSGPAWPRSSMAAKAYFVRAGMFKDVDAVLFAHVGNNFGVSYGQTARQRAVSARSSHFKGSSAHAAGAPWRGRSALDAVELMDVGWNFRREHLPPAAALALRDHRRRRPAERRAADGDASGTTSARPTTPHIKELWAIGDTIAQRRRDDDEHRARRRRDRRLRLAAALQQGRSPRR